MKLLAWIMTGLFGAILLAIAAAWLVPPWLDWSDYRVQIANLASEQLGRDVHIEGPIALSLLPEPILTASRVSVDQGGDGIRLNVDALRLRVALGPLMSGHVDARELVMRGFDMRVPWPLDVSRDTMHAPTWLSGLSARIEAGRLAIGGLVFTDIDATLATGGPTGVSQAAGTATLSGRPWRVTTRLTPPGADGSAAIDVTLDGQGPVQGVGVAFSGQIAADGGVGGRVTARGPDLAQLLPAPHVPFHADGRVTVAGGLAAADDLAVEIGGSPAHGAVAFRVSPVPRLDVAMAVSRLDLDAWLPVVLGSGPGTLTVGLDLSAEAADWGGGILRRVRGAFDLTGTTVNVRELQAVLPGDAGLRVAGRIDHPDGAHPRFAGEAHVTAPSLRTTLDWVGRAGLFPAPALPDGVLRTGDLTGFATVEPGRLSVVGLSGQIDGQDVIGSVAARNGARLALTASLRMQVFDLDPWLPTRLLSPAALSETLRPYDVDLRLDVGDARAGGHALVPLSLDAAVEAGRLTLRRLDLGLAGARVTASGTLVEGGRLAEGRIDVRADSAAPLADLIPPAFAQWRDDAAALSRGALHAQLLASGAPDSLVLTLAADLGDLRLEAHPTLDLDRRRWSGPVALHHPGASRLAETLGLTGAPAWLGDGSLAVLATLSGAPGTLVADTFDVTAGALHASGQVGIDVTGARPALSGRIDAETVPLPLPYARSPSPLPVAALAGWDGSFHVTAGKVLLEDIPALAQVAATLAVRDGVLRVDGLTGRLGGGTLSGSARLDVQRRPPSLSVDARTSGMDITGPMFDTSVDLAGGTLDFSAALAASGYSPAALLATLTGEVDATARNPLVRGLDLSTLRGDLSDDAVRAALSGGKTRFETLHLAARLDHGNLTVGDATMSGQNGTASVTGTVDLPGEGANLRFAIRPAMSDPPELGLRLTGALDALQRTPERAGLVTWRLDHGDVASAGMPGPAQRIP